MDTLLNQIGQKDKEMIRVVDGFPLIESMQKLLKNKKVGFCMACDYAVCFDFHLNEDKFILKCSKCGCRHYQILNIKGNRVGNTVFSECPSCSENNEGEFRRFHVFYHDSRFTYSCGNCGISFKSNET